MWYRFFYWKRKTWEEAENFCASQELSGVSGGHLAVLFSELQYDIVRKAV